MPIETPVGRFAFTDPDARWWWSDPLYEMHGLRPGEVVPTLDLMARHVDPGERDAVVELLRRGAADRSSPPEPFACLYRLRRLDGCVRTVALAGARDLATGTCSGTVVDVTAGVQAEVAGEVSRHLEQALLSHAVIDQAKGALMLAFGIDGDEAFELLRWSSQQRNVRVSVLAQRVVAAQAGSQGFGPLLRQRLDRFFVACLDGAPPRATTLVPQDRSPRFAVDVSGAVPTLRVGGPLELVAAHRFASALSELITVAAGASAVLVDLQEVPYVSPVADTVLQSARRHAAERLVRLRVVPPALGSRGSDDEPADRASASA